MDRIVGDGEMTLGECQELPPGVDQGPNLFSWLPIDPRCQFLVEDASRRWEQAFSEQRPGATSQKFSCWMEKLRQGPEVDDRVIPWRHICTNPIPNAFSVPGAGCESIVTPDQFADAIATAEDVDQNDLKVFVFLRSELLSFDARYGHYEDLRVPMEYLDSFVRQTNRTTWGLQIMARASRASLAMPQSHRAIKDWLQAHQTDAASVNHCDELEQGQSPW